MHLFVHWFFTKELIRIKEHNKIGGGNRLYAQGQTKNLLSWIRLRAFCRLTNLLVPELCDIASLVTKSHPMSVILPLRSLTYIEDGWAAAWKLLEISVCPVITNDWIEGRSTGICVYISVCVCVFVSVCAGQVNNLFHQAKQLCALLKVSIKEYYC